jgi:hypothetical protein
VSTVTEIQEAIRNLSDSERSALALWLRSEEEPLLSTGEEAALLARLDKAAAQLDKGRGVEAAVVREMVGKWAGR